jgi:hypothetical protein
MSGSTADARLVLEIRRASQAERRPKAACSVTAKQALRVGAASRALARGLNLQ